VENLEKQLTDLKKTMPDVDIDFFDRDGVLKLFKHTPATMIKEDKTEKHKTGVYFHAVPEHPVTRHASLDYKKAEDRGYFKIDMLNVNIYKDVKSEQELVELMIQEPDWDMLKDPKTVETLFHLNGHFNIVSKSRTKDRRTTCRSVSNHTSCQETVDVQGVGSDSKRSLGKAHRRVILLQEVTRCCICSSNCCTDESDKQS